MKVGGGSGRLTGVCLKFLTHDESGLNVALHFFWLVSSRSYVGLLVSYIFTVHLYNIRLIYYASDDWFFAATPIFTAKKFFKKAAQEPKIFV